MAQKNSLSKSLVNSGKGEKIMNEKMLKEIAEKTGMTEEKLKKLPLEVLEQLLDNDVLFGIRMSKNNEWKQFLELGEDAYAREVDNENAVDMLWLYPEQKMVKFTRFQFKDKERTSFSENLIPIIDYNMAKFIVEKLGE